MLSLDAMLMANLRGLCRQRDEGLPSARTRRRRRSSRSRRPRITALLTGLAALPVVPARVFNPQSGGLAVRDAGSSRSQPTRPRLPESSGAPLYRGSACPDGRATSGCRSASTCSPCATQRAPHAPYYYDQFRRAITGKGPARGFGHPSDPRGRLSDGGTRPRLKRCHEPTTLDGIHVPPTPTPAYEVAR
jgi:hypothetical protein